MSSTFSPSLGLPGSWILNLGLGIPSVDSWRSSRATSGQLEQHGKELEELEWLGRQRRKEREGRGLGNLGSGGQAREEGWDDQKREVGRRTGNWGSRGWRQHTEKEECSGGNHSGSSLHSWEVTKSWQAVGWLPGTSQGPSVPSQFPPSSFHTASWGPVVDTERGMLRCLWITWD